MIYNCVIRYRVFIVVMRKIYNVSCLWIHVTVWDPIALLEYLAMEF